MLKPPKPAFADFPADLRQEGMDGGVGPGRSPRSQGLGRRAAGRPDVRRPAWTGCDRWGIPAGSFRDPSGKLAGSWREAGGTLAGSWRDGSRTVRERFENDSRASGRRKGGQARPATPAMARSLRRGERARRGRWPDPGGMVRGQFENDSRTIRGRRGGGSAVRPSPRAPLRRPRFDAITRPGCCDWAITTDAIRPAAA